MPKLKKLFLDNFFLILFVGVVLSFFYPTILQKKIPIPADTIVGMYHPWRDVVWDGYSKGVPYKNFLITDPVRQQFVWRNLAINELKKGQLPLWNPYSFSGTALLANYQSATFYPLNIIFFIFPFNTAWTILVILQPMLGGIFLYLYLRFMKVSKIGSFMGAVTFAFGGFSVAWMEWNTVVHTVIWLPLILLSKEHILKKNTFQWILVLLLAEISSFFAGHLQVLFYTLIISNSYLFCRIVQIVWYKKGLSNKIRVFLSKLVPFIIIGLTVLFVTAIQWWPTFRFIAYSARESDLNGFLQAGWFIPWQNLIQFIAPDFFGNPATANYWGIWNYAEFTGYIGVIPFIFALYALIFTRSKKIFFFGGFIILSILFAFPTFIAKLPFILRIPFLSTSQPTRIMFVLDFSLAILSALGFDYFMKNRSIKNILTILVALSVFLLTLWLMTIFPKIFGISVNYENLLIAQKNLILPTLLFIATGIIMTAYCLESKNKYARLFTVCCFFIVIFDLFRFGWKFTPFSREDWIFPKTSILDILSKEVDQYRVMALDRRILAPNFSVMYKLQDVSGYDPLYLSNYNQLVSAWDRGTPDIRLSSFNRIITPTNYENFITDLLGVRYLLSLTPLKSDKLEFITSEGNTYLYKNKKAFPRVFLAENIKKVDSKQTMIDAMFALSDNLRNTVVTYDQIDIETKELQSKETTKILYYLPNKIRIEVNCLTQRLLVLTDTYYPTWKAFIDGKESKIYQVNFAFRAVLVPVGSHTVEFQNGL